MKQIQWLVILPAWWVTLACAAHHPAPQAGATMAKGSEQEAVQHEAHTGAHPLPAAAGLGYTVADVRFMQNMIGHHAQALVMAAMVPTHGAGDRVRRLAEKIDISQRDEIEFMQRWLVERDQAVPRDEAMHDMVMPGMLTREQLAQLDAAQGTEFERLFLTFMIQHHRGALAMVETLVASPGAAQDSDIFRFVTDVDADQRAEIYTMQSMLAMLDIDPGSPSS